MNMASKIDQPLEVFANRRGRGRGFRRGRGGGRFQAGGRGFGQNKSAGISTASLRTAVAAKKANGMPNGGGGRVDDLRDLIIQKTKPSVADLRSKLPPKQTKKKESLKEVPAGFTTRGKPPALTSSRSKNSGMYNNEPLTTSKRLPTASEAKKITVTVQGLSKTTSSEVYRKEERLAAAITRQKDTRQHNFMKSREEFIASTITSAFNGGASNQPVRGSSSNLYTRLRSPSPAPVEYRYDHPPYEPQVSPSMLPRQQRGGGLTTITTLVISNLNDTVSRNDIYELCSAVGPLENVNIIAPGVAEITYRHKDDALEAFKKYHQRNLDGMPMVCHLQSGGGGRGRGSMGGVYSGGSRMGYTPYQSEHPMYSGGGSIHQSTGAFY